jgi:hypothetical protein
MPPSTSELGKLLKLASHRPCNEHKCKSTCALFPADGSEVSSEDTAVFFRMTGVDQGLAAVHHICDGLKKKCPATFILRLTLVPNLRGYGPTTELNKAEEDFDQQRGRKCEKEVCLRVRCTRRGKQRKYLIVSLGAGVKVTTVSIDEKQSRDQQLVQVRVCAATTPKYSDWDTCKQAARNASSLSTSTRAQIFVTYIGMEPTPGLWPEEKATKD